MNYLISDKNTLIWFCFVLYALTAVFLLPNFVEFKSSTIDVSEQQAWQFASRFILRIALVLPMVLLLKNAI
jgi:hypothetical protein